MGVLRRIERLIGRFNQWFGSSAAAQAPGGPMGVPVEVGEAERAADRDKDAESAERTTSDS